MTVRTPIPLACAVVASIASAAWAAQMTLCIDVPSDLGGGTWQPTQTFVTDGAGTYAAGVSLVATLGGNGGLDAIHRLGANDFLFSPDAPFEVGAAVYTPIDVVRWQSGAFSLYQSGTVLGLEKNANIDALSLDTSGNLLVSFDAPVTVGATTFQPGDVARVVSGVIQSAKAFSAQAAGLGANVNTVEVEEDNGDFYLVFDAPITVGTSDFAPGTIVFYNAVAGLRLYWRDTAFPRGSAVTGLAFTVKPSSAPGSVPDGLIVPGQPLTVSETAAFDAALFWGPSCTGPSDYAVYEGLMQSWGSHAPKLCSTGGALSAIVSPSGGDRYYLVVPRNGTVEGSYGFRSGIQWRPVSASPCVPSQMERMCP